MMRMREETRATLRVTVVLLLVPIQQHCLMFEIIRCLKAHHCLLFVAVVAPDDAVLVGVLVADCVATNGAVVVRCDDSYCCCESKGEVISYPQWTTRYYHHQQLL